MALPFTKMHGAGNDFVMLDARDLAGRPALDKVRIAALCHRRKGVGADGLIIVGADADADIRMTYYNADGGEAEMCGNGARCTVAFAHRRGLVGSRCTVATVAGTLTGVVHGPADIEVGLPPYGDLELDVPVSGSPFPAHHTCNTGVPHLIVPVDDVDTVDVDPYGRMLRFHERFAPAGVNVDWISRGDDGLWHLRTYERGVEAETLACGTGASAAAAVLVCLALAVSPVAILTRGGDHLTIGVNQTDRQLQLRGPAVIAFEGGVLGED